MGALGRWGARFQILGPALHGAWPGPVASHYWVT